MGGTSPTPILTARTERDSVSQSRQASPHSYADLSAYNDDDHRKREAIKEDLVRETQQRHRGPGQPRDAARVRGAVMAMASPGARCASGNGVQVCECYYRGPAGLPWRAQ